MSDLSVTYMGLSLRNPVIAGASEMTADVDKIREMEGNGAAAVVTKSLFEEQIQLERLKMEEDREKFSYRHPEMVTVFPELEHAGPRRHLHWVKKAK
jgi:dihydroorotate dehydrogenase (fumarate)